MALKRVKDPYIHIYIYIYIYLDLQCTSIKGLMVSIRWYLGCLKEELRGAGISICIYIYIYIDTYMYCWGVNRMWYMAASSRFMGSRSKQLPKALANPVKDMHILSQGFSTCHDNLTPYRTLGPS